MTGDQHIGVAANSFGENGEVILIANRQFQWFDGLHNQRLLPKEGFHFFDRLGGQSNFPAKDASKLGEAGLAHEQLMFRQHGV